ncbi:DUF4870 domain-containing protein [Flavobacterium columnare]|uniref:DUF4870 domain-containing protein n=1 Tax=Flavobacterium columnare TaxID=996 RepID=A0AAI8CFI3_9FLAO|nr:DUF4870 domain-containing protein [Flavobacterium columnare]AMO19143.1 DUF4870 domain-containing protein [Flavobacterium columnare]QOG56091.1 DUF4870 domain-containing protein [Flavobacterium columnare]QOG58814.1 DUF4870 domain-containing protein [Flavobacterium columnare]QOG61536.1 DUF4870 domain-containing protein [Flavobacterium columnare]QOG64258.1 DUF4870 domain-containing protein [Flavobacterium columnare]
MEPSSITKQEKNYASITHLSAFSKFIFPLGNYIIPIVLWGSKKKESFFINFHGKQIINFQLSILLYTIIMAILAIPSIIASLVSTFSWEEIEKGHILLENLDFYHLLGLGIFGIICLGVIILLKIIEFFYIIYGAIMANEGVYFRYPLTIPFFK